MKTSALTLTGIIVGLIVLASVGLIVVGLAYHFGMSPLFGKLTRPSDEMRIAVRSFYEQHDRVPADVEELSIYAVSNSLPFDVAAYGTVTFIPSNDYVQVEYRRKFSSGKCYVYLNDKAESGSFESHPSIEGLVAHFYKVRGRLPSSMQEMQEHIQEHRLEFDMARYKSVSVKKKMFGRVRITYVMKPQRPRSVSGSMECALSELKNWEIEPDIGLVSPEPARSASPDEPSM